MQTAEFRAAVASWIDDHGGAELALGPELAGRVDAVLGHQRRIQRMLFNAGLMRWGWPERAGGLGGSPVLRAVLGEELTSRAIVHTAPWSMHEVLGRP